MAASKVIALALCALAFSPVAQSGGVGDIVGDVVDGIGGIFDGGAGDIIDGAGDIIGSIVGGDGLGSIIDIFVPGLGEFVGPIIDFIFPPDQATGSCAGCPQSSGNCFCDDLCLQYADCCPDIIDFNCIGTVAPTPSGGTCAAQGCGSACQPGDPCCCDNLCVSFNDCCPDFALLCPNIAPTPGGPSSGSCSIGCGGVGSDGICFCDTQCVAFGDCCSDFQALCSGGGTGGGSCAGICLSPFNPAAPCQCDSVCVNYGDCCPDFAALCTGAGPSPVVPSPVVPSPVVPSPTTPSPSLPPVVIIQFGVVSNAPSSSDIVVPLLYTTSSPVLGFQIEFSGPTPTSLDNGAAAAAGFTLSTGVSLLGFSLTLAPIPVTATFESLVEFFFPSAADGQEFCILPATVFSGAGGSGFPFGFDGPNCVTVEVTCPTAGTSDVTGDGVTDVLDIVQLVESVVSGSGDAEDPCFILTADSNGDGVVNIQDIIQIVEVITTGGR